MEALGTLSGGIAHDFNNILSAIIGYSELAALKIPKDNEAICDIEQVQKAGHRAKDLVQQILSFSRQNKEDRKPVQVSSILKESLKMLRPSITTNIEIQQNIADKTGIIEADPTQIHQVLMNLCTNAAHAMEDKGGVMAINLQNVKLKKPGIGLEPGDYILLTVSDTGIGMAPEVKERIFDPYFTTKGKSEGTGLGLSVVQGIIKSHRGAIEVNTTAGKGSTFSVYLPLIRSEDTKSEKEVTEPLPTGNERILFIDDEKSLANLGKEMLERLGYQVF